MIAKRSAITRKARSVKSDEQHPTKIHPRREHSNENLTPPEPLVRELRALIQEAREAVARTVDSGLVVVY